MRVIVGCEFSQVVTRAFRDKGHEAYSCDLLPTEGNPAWHFQEDILELLKRERFDLAIFHPPCTWLCQAMRTNAARKDRPKISENFINERQKAFEFVVSLYDAQITKIAVENPIGYLNGAWRKPDQVLRAWHFGHPYKKDICLWLKNLPKLTHTCVPEGWLFGGQEYPTNLKTLDFWSNKRNPDGKSLKSKTFPGIANAMADQWGNKHETLQNLQMGNRGGVGLLEVPRLEESGEETQVSGTRRIAWNPESTRL